MKLLQGDCLERMQEISDGAIDMILCDLPYGTTANTWDEVIPYEPLWQQYKRIIRRGGAIVLFAQTPFDKTLGASNLDWLRYEWIWQKNNATGFLNAKKAPLKAHENILVFYETLGDLDTTDLFTDVKKYIIDEKAKTGLNNKQIRSILNSYMASHYFTTKSQFMLPTPEAYKRLQSTGYFKKPYEDLKAEYDKEMEQVKCKRCSINTYNPQGLIKLDKPEICTKGIGSKNYRFAEKKEIRKEFTGYPQDILKFDRVQNTVHPTQKPVELLEYLIKTYTNEGETVLDNCMGSGSTGVACINTNRNFVGIEKDKNFFDIAKERIERNALKNGIA